VVNKIIEFSLRNRLLIIAATVLIFLFGGYNILKMPMDVFPDLNRPTVTIMTETHGLAPEEVELLVTFPIESMVNGATGVRRVRSASGIGLSIVWVEFDWGTDIYRDRQIVAEKLQLASESLPGGATPVMAPISSIMGEIMLLGVRSANGNTSPLEVRTLADWVIRPRLLSLGGIAQVTVMGGGLKQYQVITNPERLAQYDTTLSDLAAALEKGNINTSGGFLLTETKEYLVRITGRVEFLDDIENTVIEHRREGTILVKHVADVRYGHPVKRGDGSVNGESAIIMAIQKQPGADTQVLTKVIDKAIDEIRDALPRDVVVENHIFRQADFIEAAIRNVEEAIRDGVVWVIVILFLFLWNFRTSFITIISIPLSIIITGLFFDAFGFSINTMTLGGLAVAVGELVDDSIVGVENIFRRLKENRHSEHSKPILTVIYTATREVRNPIIYATFIVVLVVVPLFFLSGLSGRMFFPLGLAYLTTLLCSLVVSITVTPVLSYYLLPKAKLMQKEKDAFLLRWIKIVDTWMLRFVLRHPLKILLVSALMIASSFLGFTYMGGEFLPPFNEGTYTVNIISVPGTSLKESNRLGALSEGSFLEIPEIASSARRTGRAELDEHAEGVNYSEIDVRLSLENIQMAELRAGGTLTPGQIKAWRLKVQKALMAVPGVDLVEVDFEAPPVSALAREAPFSPQARPLGTAAYTDASDRRGRQEDTGRYMVIVRALDAQKPWKAVWAALEEAVESSQLSLVRTLERGRDRDEVAADIRRRIATIPGVVANIGQPISHRLDHIMSGVNKQVTIKIFGGANADLEKLRRLGQEVHDLLLPLQKQGKGVVDLELEPQIEVPQVRIRIKREAVARYGLKVDDVAEALELALGGHVVTEVLEQQRKFGVFVRYDEKSRNNMDAIRETLIDTPSGGRITLSTVADVLETTGPNTINRENTTRRIVVSCNTANEDLATVVNLIRERVDAYFEKGWTEGTIPKEYYPRYGGQFESQQEANRQLLIFGLLALIGMYLLLVKCLRNGWGALQVMLVLPSGYVGGVAAVFLFADGTLSVATLVGFITLTGILARNGILMISHYVHLMKYEGEQLDEKMIIRGSLERLAPVLMTAFTTGIALIPLALGAGQTGKEILHPLAIVVIGGLITSSLLDQIVRPPLFFKFGRKVYDPAKAGAMEGDEGFAQAEGSFV
jgi:Cu/Ag efflux pump CusA